MCIRDSFFFNALVFSNSAQALSIVCGKGKHLQLDLPEDSISWKLDTDDVLGAHYSFELKMNIENVKLESMVLLRRNGEKIDFFIPLSFLEVNRKIAEESSYASSGFSLSKEALQGAELLAIYQRRYENCILESRKYKIELPNNK